MLLIIIDKVENYYSDRLLNLKVIMMNIFEIRIKRPSLEKLFLIVILRRI